MAYLNRNGPQRGPSWLPAAQDDDRAHAPNEPSITRHGANGLAADRSVSAFHLMPNRRVAATWPLLADDLFRIAHDDDGNPVLHPDVTALALAAALLGELILSGHIGVRDGVVNVHGVTPPGDALAHTVLDHLAGEPARHPVRVWLAFLAQSAYGEVALRLVRAGHVREQSSRRLLRRSTRYVPTDMNQAAWPWARLSSLLRADRRLDDFDTVLGGLVLATDLHRTVLTGAAADITTGLRREINHAPAAVRELIGHTEATVGDAVATLA